MLPAWAAKTEGWNERHPMPIEVTGAKSEKTEGGVTTYTLTLKICNKNDKEIKLKVASNAWLEKISNDQKEHPVVLKKDGTTDLDATRKKVIEDTWKNPETNDDQPLTLSKQGTKGDCKEYVIKWKTQKPTYTYIDVFLCKPDGTLEEKFEDGGYNHAWDEIKFAAFYPNGPKQNYCCAFPISFPMALERVWGKDIKIAIDQVEGLPPGIDLLEVFPHMGIPYPLDVGDRGSVGALFLRQSREVKGRHTVRVSYHVADPEHLREWGRTLALQIVPGKPFRTAGRGKTRPRPQG
jgi:hypothetical protein